MTHKLEVKLKLDIFFGLYVHHAEINIPQPHNIIERAEGGNFIQFKYTEKTNESPSGRMYKKYVKDNMAIVKWYEDSAGVRERLDSFIPELTEEYGLSIKNLNIDMAGSDPRDGIVMKFNIYHDGSLSINDLRDDLSVVFGMLVNPQPAGEKGLIKLDSDGLEDYNASIEGVINEEESVFKDMGQQGGALYGHMGVSTPNSNKIYRKLYVDTPVNRKLKRVGKPHGYTHSKSKKEKTGKKNPTKKQIKGVYNVMPKLRSDFKKCNINYTEGRRLTSSKLTKLYKECRKYDTSNKKKLPKKKSDLIGTKYSPHSGMLREYSQKIRKKLFMANKILIDYKARSSKSPKRRSKSPKRRSKSPIRRSKSPRTRSKSPKQK